METGRRERLAVIIVSANSASWLRPCLASVFERSGAVELDVVVVASGCTDETVVLVDGEFPRARIVSCENHGFAYGNNRALETVDADWVLFLNPDTEILEGSLAGLVEGLRSRPTVGLVGVRQVTPDGQLFPTIRRFPNAVRALFEALGSERLPMRSSWLGERELDMSVYERDVACDWTSGSCMLVRADVIRSVGYMDERFFLFSEETDLCLRVKQAGWEVRHVPTLTILHHANKAGWSAKLEAQAAFSKRQYIEKHFSPVHRTVATGALALGYGLRSVLWRVEQKRRESSRAALATLLGLRPPPFGEPPSVALLRDSDP
jgi:hypothetical protein